MFMPRNAEQFDWTFVNVTCLRRQAKKMQVAYVVTFPLTYKRDRSSVTKTSQQIFDLRLFAWRRIYVTFTNVQSNCSAIRGINMAALHLTVSHVFSIWPFFYYLSIISILLSLIYLKLLNIIWRRFCTIWFYFFVSSINRPTFRIHDFNGLTKTFLCMKALSPVDYQSSDASNSGLSRVVETEKR